MKKKSLSLCLCTYLFVTHFVSSQSDTIQINKRSQSNTYNNTKIEGKRWIVHFEGNYITNSNAITNHFFKVYQYQKGFIDNYLKDEVTNRLKKTNRFGADARINFFAGHQLKEKLMLNIGASYRNFASTRFPGDIFELAFRGNKPFAGKTANLRKFTFTRFDYASIDISLLKPIKEYIKAGAGISLIRGGKVRVANINGTLFTEENGEYIDLNTNIRYYFIPKDTAKKHKSNGIGTALHLYGEIEKNNLKATMAFTDIGFIHWRNSRQYKADSTYRYNGLMINDLLYSSNASLVSDLNVDSIANELNIRKSTVNRFMLIPFTIQLNAILKATNKKWLTGLDYICTPGYIPRFYAGIEYGNSLFVSGRVAYGGFGRVDYEIGAGYEKQNSFRLSVKIMLLEYLLLPAKTSGHGIMLTLEQRF